MISGTHILPKRAAEQIEPINAAEQPRKSKTGRLFGLA